MTTDAFAVCRQVLFVDLDARSLRSVVGDEERIIPRKLQKALIAALSDDNTGRLIAVGRSVGRSVGQSVG